MSLSGSGSATSMAAPVIPANSGLPGMGVILAWHADSLLVAVMVVITVVLVAIVGTKVFRG